MDRRPRLPLAGRAVLPLAALLALAWGGSGPQPGAAGAPAAPAAVRAGLPGGILGGQAHLVALAARHGERNRRAAGSTAVLAAALGVMVVAAGRRPPAARAARPDRRHRAARSRAPPSLLA